MKNVLIFIAGTAIGSLVTWSLLKSKYEKRIQDEVDELKGFYKNKYEGPQQGSDDTCSEPEETEEKEEKTVSYNEIVSNYTNEEPETTSDKPYIIDVDIFGEEDGYEVITLTLYSDGFLADDDDRLIKDIENTVGNEAIKYFDKYDEDSVYVRNDRLKTDFEILSSQIAYSEVLNRKPYLMEDADVEDS